MSTSAGYALIDSGEGEKLERFGAKVIRRPASLCMWKRRESTQVWNSFDAAFEPRKDWKFQGPRFEEWDIELEGLKLALHLQTSGQVGIFPEHQAILPLLEEQIERSLAAKSECKVLNLFAYTGMATVACLQRGAHVTHVDISKKALEWTRKNLELNKLDHMPLRLVCEDAGSFLEREARRKETYDIVLADPPSFSRISKQKTWQLEDHLGEFVNSLVSVLHKESGALLFSSHHTTLKPEVIANVIDDAIPGKQLQTGDLSLKEEATNRLIPSGSFVYCRW